MRYIRVLYATEAFILKVQRWVSEFCEPMLSGSMAVKNSTPHLMVCTMYSAISFVVAENMSAVPQPPAPMSYVCRLRSSTLLRTSFNGRHHQRHDSCSAGILSCFFPSSGHPPVVVGRTRSSVACRDHWTPLASLSCRR